MKTLKEKLVQEGLIKRQAGVDIRAKIEAWLKEYNITSYTINKDLTIDVYTNVKFYKFEGEELPEFIQFGKCEGSFSMSYCEKLKSLRGCPEWVLKDFRVQDAKITSLKYGPEYVGGVFDCCGCKKLKNIDDLPKNQLRYDFMKTPFESEMVERFNEDCATPGNTMGMGNPVAPTATTPG